MNSKWQEETFCGVENVLTLDCGDGFITITINLLKKSLDCTPVIGTRYDV